MVESKSITLQSQRKGLMVLHVGSPGTLLELEGYTQSARLRLEKEKKVLAGHCNGCWALGGYFKFPRK